MVCQCKYIVHRSFVHRSFVHYSVFSTIISVILMLEMKGTTQEKIKTAFNKFLTSTRVSVRPNTHGVLCIQYAFVFDCVCNDV